MTKPLVVLLISLISAPLFANDMNVKVSFAGKKDEAPLNRIALQTAPYDLSFQSEILLEAPIRVNKYFSIGPSFVYRAKLLRFVPGTGLGANATAYFSGANQNSWYITTQYFHDVHPRGIMPRYTEDFSDSFFREMEGISDRLRLTFGYYLRSKRVRKSGIGIFAFFGAGAEFEKGQRTTYVLDYSTQSNQKSERIENYEKTTALLDFKIGMDF